MKISFQGRSFPVLPVTDQPGAMKVMYLNRTRNIAGSVMARDTDKLRRALKVQSRCCTRPGETPDHLEPRP